MLNTFLARFNYTKLDVSYFTQAALQTLKWDPFFGNPEIVQSSKDLVQTFHGSCSNCIYDLCLLCCWEIRDGHLWNILIKVLVACMEI